MKRKTGLILMMLCLISLTACVAGPNDLGNSTSVEGSPAGFWLGLWHGLISPITLVISLFNHNVGVYEVNNTGGWYISGFIFGLLIFLGSGNQSRKHDWHHRMKAMNNRTSDEGHPDA
jgi:uncharacterized membrane protein